MRTIEEIMADPFANEAEINYVAYYNLDSRELPGYQRMALSHPNCPPNIWWELAEGWAVTAIESPAFAIFTLEDPARWEALTEEHCPRWVQQELFRMTETHSRLFAMDCAKHVWDDWKNSELLGHLETIVSSALGVAYTLAFPPTLKTSEAARSKYETKLRDLRDMMQERSVRWKVISALCGMLHEHAETAARSASQAATSMYGRVPWQKECLWQWNRLLYYLRGET